MPLLYLQNIIKINQIESGLFFIKLNLVVIIGLWFKQLLAYHQELLRVPYCL